ncbi:MAG TPA: glutamine amidotransferase [Planctomycetota bacterium]|nr:glutamine amidotransferase [Planctomycetota bacterium]
MRNTLLASLCVLLCGTVRAGEGTAVLEAEKLVAGRGEVFREKAASGGQVAIVRWGRMLEASPKLAPGLYEATAWVSAHPIELLHRLAVTLQAGGEQRTAQAAWFDRSGVYIPIILRVAHAGGSLALALDARGASGFDGMRRQKSEEEKEYLEKLEKDFLGKGPVDTAGDALGELEEGKDLRSLGPQELYVACDRIEVRKLADIEAIVTAVRLDKVHYLPGEEVKAEVDARAVAGAGDFHLTALEVRERSTCRAVFEKDVQLGEEPTTLSFACKLDEAEFGRELLAVVTRQGKVPETTPAALADPARGFPGSRSEVFGVSRNVYRVGITGGAGGHHRAGMTAEQFAKTMQANKRAYANYFEVFAWAPCDYSEMTPDTEFFLSGQTQYHGSVSAFKALLAEAHKVGVKGITYGKACAGGTAGWETFRRHPDFFGIAAWCGVSSDRIGVFNCERMLRNEHSLAGPEAGGWQDWQSAWVNAACDAAVDLGADEIAASAKMLGWDGVRWDGHFVGNMARCKKRLNAALPHFVHGYNIAFARPGSKLFLPDKNVEDFHECARGHGLMMDESVRDWSHTNFSPGHTRPFYEAICREADYLKRIGGLPLFITFDMASELDRAYNVLCGLAAGQRYTYLTTPGVWPYGDMAKWLTRFSAFVWDDTKRLKDPEHWLAVGDGKAELWWSESCWLRDVAPGRKQLLVSIVNPPRYPAFCNRVQLPSAKRSDVRLILTLPEGVKVASAAHLSPDLPAGQEALEAQVAGGKCSVVVPRIATWSIVLFDLECAAEPFPLTSPVEDAAAAMAAQREAEEKAKKNIRPAPPKPGRNWDDYGHTHNYDADEEKAPEVAKQLVERLARPKEIRLARNGELDVHHCRGLFSWLNDVASAVGVVGGGNQSVSYLERRGWTLNPRSLDEFPETYAQLLQNDVLVLDNIHAEELGLLRRVMVKDFVEAGGGLLVFGGHFNLSAGRDHTTWLEALMPLTIRRYADLAKEPKGFPLAPRDAAFFPDRIDWAKAPSAFTVDTSPLKPGAKVLVAAGEHPALVAGTFGKGRVIVVMINSHGDPAPGTTPYWAWPHWPRVVGACIAWLAEGFRERSAEAARAERDPNAPTPDALFVGASEMKDEELTAKLRLAARNVVDKDSARLLVQCALIHSKRLTDPEVLTPVIEAAEPFIDASWLDLAEKMLDALEPRLVGAGLRVLGASKDATKRDILEKALDHRDEEVVREALVALGSLGDPQAAPALERFLAKESDLRFVAATALMRLRTPGSTRRALEQYAHHLKRIRDLKGGRASLLDDLYGGTSFKLTPLARRRLEKRLQQLIRTQKLALQDAAHFEKLLRTMDDVQTAEFVEFLAACDNPDVTPLAHAVLARLPAEKLRLYGPKLAAARLPGIRLLAE